jgi:hypothetical protein
MEPAGTAFYAAIFFGLKWQWFSLNEDDRFGCESGHTAPEPPSLTGATDLPVGQDFKKPVQPNCKKYFA